MGLIPGKDLLYGVLIAVILATFGWYTYHERAIGEQKVQQADAKIAAAAVIHDQEVTTLVSSKLAAAVAAYETAHPAPPPAPVPHLVCRNTSVGSTVPGGPGAGQAGNGGGTAVPVGASQVDEGFDPAPAVSADGTAADQEIAHLLEKIKLLQDTIAAYQAGGLVAHE